MSEISVMSQVLNEQIANMKRSIDKFSKVCSKVIEEFETCTNETGNEVTADDDTISRKQAIDALRTCYDTETITYTNGNECIDYDQALKEIEQLPSAQAEPHWIPCSERLPEEDHWLGGSGRQFSEKVMVTIVNHSDEDTWVDMTYTIDGEWACELPKYCKIVAWMPLPEAYREGES